MTEPKRSLQWAKYQLQQWENTNKKGLNLSRIRFRVSNQMWEVLDKSLTRVAEFKDLSTLIRAISPKISVTHTADGRRQTEKIDPPEQFKGMLKPLFHKRKERPKPLPARNGQSRDPAVTRYETEHNCRIYGSQVQRRKDEWRCLNMDQTGFVYAASFEELLSKAPYIARPNPVKTEKLKNKPPVISVAPPVKPKNKKGRPIELQLYESTHGPITKGFNVRLAKSTWSCFNADKSETLSFPTLSIMLDACPHLTKHLAQST